MQSNILVRHYSIKECISFSKTNEEFGGLSNMASGYPITVNKIRILTSEALYQCCRFPDNPEIQKQIISAFSPMHAKNISREYKHLSRHDWEIIRVQIMRWALRAKLASNYNNFSKLLLDTQSYPIVELSTKDDFWGAKPNIEPNKLIGSNILGRLLMELRELVRNEGHSFHELVPLPIEHFYLNNQQILPVIVDRSEKYNPTTQITIF